MSRRGRQVLVLLLASVGLLPLAAQACAVCYGESDAPMSRGLTWAVVVLGGMITVVLIGVAGFFVHVSRRTKASAPATAQIDSGS